MASTAKVLTALAVLSKKPIGSDSKITFSSSDVAIYRKYLKQDGSVVPVEVGEQMTELQALQAMLLPSANNIADSLAIWAFGSMNKFLDYANSYAQNLDLRSTHLADASGFSPRSVSSASNLVSLGIQALGNPTIAKIVATKQVDLPLAGNVHNVNWLLGVDNINGIKTGNTTEAGGCFLVSSEKVIDGQSLRLVAAVMDSRDLQTAMTEGRNLIDDELVNFKPVALTNAGGMVGSFNSKWDQTADVRSADSLSAVTWPGSLVSPSFNLTQPEVPAVTGQRVGEISFSVGGKTFVSSLELASPITKPSWSWRLTHPF